MFTIGTSAQRTERMPVGLFRHLQFLLRKEAQKSFCSASLLQSEA